jgi:hypothetical protein
MTPSSVAHSNGEILTPGNGEILTPEVSSLEHFKAKRMPVRFKKGCNFFGIST